MVKLATKVLYFVVLLTLYTHAQAEAYPGPPQILKIESFATRKPLTITAKFSFLNFFGSPGCASSLSK